MDQSIGAIAAAKKNGNYAGREGTFDQELIGVIRRESAKARENAEDYKKSLGGYAKEIKKDLAEMEARLKSKTFDDGDLKYVDDRSFAVSQIAAEVGELAKEYKDAMREYEGNWDASAKRALSNPGLIVPFEKERSTTINDATIRDLPPRIDEYRKRSIEFKKQAAQRAKGGQVEIEEFRKEINEYQGKIDKDLADIAKIHGDLEGIGDAVAKIKPKAATEDDLKATKKRSATVAAKAKEARGRLKTMDIELDGMEKRSKTAGPGWQDDGLKAVKAAKGSLGRAEKLVKQIDDIEEAVGEKLKEMQAAKDKRG